MMIDCTFVEQVFCTHGDLVDFSELDAASHIRIRDRQSVLHTCERRRVAHSAPVRSLDANHVTSLFAMPFDDEILMIIRIPGALLMVPGRISLVSPVAL